ncbi:hypothetical protein LJK88_24355 [Paenibacillus sp. P26]|nr:hypothetical protein LJK88_24355 [Paenibacillus sp. P26]UUZ95392.1 hypothetical protein LJK87_13545 [Paenibacillus sp. P25]
MKQLTVIVLILAILTACSTSATSSSYPSAFAWNDAIYGISAEEVPESEIGRKLGEIRHIVRPKPRKNGDSNEKTGSIYEILGSDHNEVLAIHYKDTFYKASKNGPLI